MFVSGRCCICRHRFIYDPALVPATTVISDKLEPVCQTCLRSVNEKRKSKGLPAVIPKPGAYFSEYPIGGCAQPAGSTTH